MENVNWFKTKKVTASFAVVALISGFLFLDRGVTGNIILTSKYTFDFVSLIGLLLVFCSVILAAHSIKR